MKVYQSDQIKNISLLGSSGSGKTTLAEAMLFEGGVITRRGEIENKNTVSDYHNVEHEYGYSIYSSVLFTEWLGKKINFIDCPGSDDFIGGAITSLNVTDTALMLLNATQGVEVGSENLFRYTEQHHKPVIIVINQLDHEKANFEQTHEQAIESFGKKVVIVQYPINAGDGYNALIDVLKMKMYKWKPEGGEPDVLDIPESEKEKAEEYHNALVEAAAENDENLMELFFEKGSLNEDQMRQGIHKGLMARDMFPVFCIAAKKDMGVRRLMEFLGNVVPFVSEMQKPVSKDGTEINCDPNGPTSIFVFKTSVEPHLGEVSFFKVLSGKIQEGMDLQNMNRNAKERVSQLYCVAGNTRHKITELVAGDIGATVKLKETHTNHTLNSKGCEYILDSIKYPNPKYRTAIKAVNESDEEKLSEILQRIHEEDPTINIEYSKELKQAIVSGQGEFHLNTMKWSIEHNDKLEIEFIKPRIPYRETITKMARADFRHKKQSGGAGQFGEVHLIIEPYFEGMPDTTIYKFNGQEFKINARNTDIVDLEWGGKLIFVNSIVGGAIDARFLPAILKGIMEKMEEGPLTGSYARDIRVIVYDGKMHPVDSNEISFKLAGRNAFSQAFREASPKILEPVYDVEVKVPSDKMGDIMSDLQGRRAIIEGMSSEKGFEIIKAKVPLKEMHKYSTSLSSITGGRASYTMSFSSYDKVPPEVQDQLLKAYAEETQEA
ncbi:MAG: elongation factor G [Marinilabiliaceae bacterium]|nr:elongation factor G [Marinilabiliaceae bacterium]